MSEELVALARQEGSLAALVSRANRDESDGPTRFTVCGVPLDQTKATARPHVRRALEAWRSLDRLRLDDAQSVSSAMIVLLETIPADESRSGVPPSVGRVWLCGRQAWAGLRPLLRAQGGRVLSLLRDAGYGPAVAGLTDARDPYVAYHHGAPDQRGLLALPARFRAFILPTLAARPWPVVRRALALFWALDLRRDETLLAIAVRMLISHAERGLGWLSLVAAAPPQRRETIARLVVESGGLACDPGALPGDALAVLEPAPDGAYADRLAYLLRGLRQGAAPSHLLEGIRLADAFAPHYRFTAYGSRRPRPRHPSVSADLETDLRDALLHLAPAFGDEGPGSFAVQLWRWSASHPGRAALLRRSAFASWPASTTVAVLRLVMNGDIRGWADAQAVRIAERLLARVPPSHHVKATEGLGEMFALGPGDAVRFEAGLGLLARVSRPPFRADGDCAGMAALLADAAGARMPRLARVPDRSLERLERALREDHGSNPLRSGLASLGSVLPEFLFDALAGHPEPLIAAARHLGILSQPRRLAVLKRLRAHPVWRRRFAKRPLDEMCGIIEPLVRRGTPNPIPRKLRDHREGRHSLSAGSLERHRQAIVRRLLPLRIRLLRLSALQEMARGVHVDLASESERHGLQMLGSVRPNRRLLRRILRIPPPGRRAFLENHPKNAAWLERHPHLDALLWSRGLTEEAVLADGRRLFLTVETDPMEVLRLGSRVGSCLSIGGICSSSAVAVMADANKRVIFARTAEGMFVARQLAAVTEDERVVFFPVYPLGVDERVKDEFERYDRVFAGALGLPICRQDEYAIASVLARGFYDDGPWDRFLAAE